MKQATKKAKARPVKTKAALPAQPTSAPVESSDGLLELFTDGIKDMYWAENHLVKSIPKMISAAGDSELQTALEEHLEITKKQAGRLEEIFDLLGTKIQAKKCDACEGLVMSGEHIIENTVAGTMARDTGLIMSGLKIENFEITSYEGLIRLASQLGNTEAAELLQENLNEEMEAAQELKALSQQPAAEDAGEEV